MKIEQLHLMAFGPFTERTLNFATNGLHLVFGRNEAGKSSALRAMDSLFFGIPTKTSDNFLHPYDKLRIGATLSNASGDKVSFARRKSHKKPFLSLDTEQTQLNDNLLDPFLQGLEQKRFRDIYCIDHPELRAGGELMRTLKGLAGDSLLVASASSDLPQIQTQLQEEIDALFTSRGRKSKIKRGVTEYNAAKKEKGEHEVRVSKWTSLQAALDEQERKKSDLREATKTLRADQNRLERLRDALPKIAEWKTVNEELSGADVQILPDSYSIQRRQQCDTELKSIDARIKELQEDAEITKAKLKQVTESPLLLSEVDAIETLQQRIGAHGKGQEERRKIAAEIENAKMEVLRLLKEIDTNVPIERVEELRLRREHRAALFELAERELTVRERPRTLSKERASQKKEFEKLKAQSTAIGESVDTASLELVLREISQVSNVEDELAANQAKLDSLQRKTQQSLASLPLWSGSLPQLVTAKLPLRETVDQHSQATVLLSEKLDTVRRRIADTTQDLERLEQETEAIKKATAVVTERDLDAERIQRNKLWSAIERDWNGEADTSPDKRRSMSDSFTQQFAKVDEIADRLRREADRVAEQAQREVQALTLAKQTDKLSAELAELHDQQAALESQWRDAWKTGGVEEPRTAKEMAGWLRQRDQLVDDAEQQQDIQLEIQRLTDVLNDSKRKLESELNQLQIDVADGRSLREQLSQARSFVDEQREANNQREQLQKDLLRINDDIDSFESDEKSAAEELEQWEQNWSVAMKWIGCEPHTTSALARARVECLDELSQRHAQWLQQNQRIVSIDAEAESFACEVTAIAGRAEIEVADWAPIDTARRLKSWLDDAKREDQVAKTLREGIASAEEKACELLTAQKQNQAQLAQFHSLAGVKDNDNLRHIESQSDRALTRRTVRDEIQRISGGGDFEQFVASAEDSDIDELEAKLTELEEEIQEKEDQKELIVARITEITNDMEAIDGNASAAQADQRAINCLASVHELTRRYATLKIAQSMLQQHIERYQEENRDPLLAKASDYFATMTCNEFLGLQVDYDDNNRPIIQGVRKNREFVDVAAMSDGTRDPMFLALRLAYIQKRLGQHEPMPFIVDDILIHLDDDRATATLQVLAELSEQTQVLFFTHHDRLRELAEKNLPGELLTVHELEKNNRAGGIGAEWLSGWKEVAGRTFLSVSACRNGQE